MGDAEQAGTPAAASAVDWNEVRRAYELSGESVASIRRRFGLTPHALRVVRVAEGWTPRPPIAKPGPLQGKKPVGSEALELRLSRLLAVGVAMLEKRLAEEGMTETNARTLTELVRAQEITMRSKRNEKAAKARETKKHDAGYDFRDDPAWLDAEIDRRIARLREDREAGGAEGADTGGEAGVSGGLE
jgi:transposase-like protein